MENPFVKLVREGEPSAEGKKIVDTRFELREDGAYVYDIFSDRTESEGQPLGSPSNDPELGREKYSEYRRRRGLPKEQ